MARSMPQTSSTMPMLAADDVLEDPSAVPMDAQGNKTNPFGRRADNFLRDLLGGEGVGGNVTDYGILPQAQIGATGAPTPALGIQAGTLEEDINQEAGGEGDVWNNIMPALESGGDPTDETDNISRVRPSFPTPPRKPDVPNVPNVPIVPGAVFDDDPTSPHEFRLGERQQRRDLWEADPDYWGYGGEGNESIISDILRLFGMGGPAAPESVTSPAARGPQNRPRSEALPPQVQAPIKPTNIPTRGRRSAPQETVPSPPVPQPVPVPQQAGPNTVPPTGDDAGDLRGRRGPINEAEYMEELRRTGKVPSAIDSNRPTVPDRSEPEGNFDLMESIRRLFQSIPYTNASPSVDASP